MNKLINKIITLATLASFFVFSCSCVIHTWQKTPLESVKPEKRAQIKISAVCIQSGEKIEFKKDPPARIQGDSVIGARLVKNLVLEKSKIKQPRSFKRGAAAQITTADGARYSANRILGQNDSTVTYEAYFPASIPLADINLVWIRKANMLATLLVDVVLPIGIVVGLAAVAMSGFNMSMGSWGGSWFWSF